MAKYDVVLKYDRVQFVASEYSCARGVGAVEGASRSPAHEGGGGGMLVGAPSSSFTVAGASRTPPLPRGWAVAGAGDAVGIS